MKDLEKRAAHVLDAARVGHDPSAADALRVRAALAARVRAEPMLIEPHAPEPRGTGLLGKWSVAFGIGGSAGFAAGFLAASIYGPAAPPAALAPVPGSDAPALVAPSRTTPNETVVSEPDVTNAPTKKALQTAEAPAAESPAETPRAARPPIPPRAEPTPSATSTLKEELEGLRRAQELLHQGDAAWALARLDELDRAKASSVLLEERMATRAIAECMLGRGTQTHTDLARRFPESPHLERVRASCTAGPKANTSPPRK